MREIKFKEKTVVVDRPYSDDKVWFTIKANGYKQNGYIKRGTVNHPNADKRGYCFEHRLVMEEHIERFLEPTEIVHHIDQNRENNDIANLELQGNQAEHIKSQKHLIGKRNTL